jgi:hypothetical protein
LTLVAAAAFIAWAGGDAWKTKPYQQWDQKDIQQVLNDSPWVKVQSISVTWRTDAPPARPEAGGEPGEGGAGEGEEGGGGGGAGVGTKPTMGTPARSTPGGGSPEGGEGGGGGAPFASFIVRWNSAQTIREAIVRSALLANKISEADALKFVAQAPADIEIGVLGRDMTPFNDATEDDLKTKAYLEAKQSKQKVAPSRVEITKSPDKKRVIAVFFSFPRQAAANQSLISPKDKNAEFGCKIKGLDLKASFDIHKMATEKGSDL